MSNAIRSIERAVAARRVGLLLLISLLAVTQPVQAAGRRVATPAVVEASVLSDQAVKFFEQKDYLTAAKLFLRAYALDPAPDYAYSAARAEEDGGALVEAERHYRTLLDTTDRGNRFYAKAADRLAKVQTLLAKAQAARAAEAAKTAEPPPPPPAAEPAAPPVAVPPAQPAAAPAPPVDLPVATTPQAQAMPVVFVRPAEEVGAQTLAGRWIIGLSVAAEAAAIVLLATATADQGSLDAKRTLNGAFDPRRVQLADVQNEQRSINARVIAGWSVAGVGGLGLAAGTWLLVTSPSRVVVLPAPDVGGARIAVRF